MALEIHSSDWSVQKAATLRTAKGRRTAATAPSSDFPFLTDESEVAAELTAEPKAAVRRAGAAPGPLDLSYDLAEGESAVLAIRHPSGALTFHRPVETTRRSGARRGARSGAQTVRFTVSVHSTDPETGRRGIVSKAIKALVIKVGKAVGNKLLGLALARLSAAFETASFRKHGLQEGWLEVSREGLERGKLTPGVPRSTERSLLFIHGTLSNTARAFGALGSSKLFERVAPIYGNRVFAFDHFSLSRTPQENARMLLEQLPEAGCTFDVITHSRGGLVLRNLVERSAELGPIAKRFKLGRAVLVASPNEGTPIATPERWDQTVGWLANLLELFPDNPLTTGAEFVANALVWIARRASGDLPGLHAMDGAGDVIGELQSPPGPPPDAYSALVSNYSPSQHVLARMIDCGVDQFFGSANDLVVPAEGGFRVDRSGTQFIPGTRIGCFGPGGNLPSDAVWHSDFFAQRETVDFLVTALLGQAQPLVPIDPGKPLPDRRLLRSSAGISPAAPAGVAGPTSPLAPMAALRSQTENATVAVDGGRVVASDTFHLVVMPRAEGGESHSQILAHYGSARVLETFYLKGTDDNAGRRWKTIIARNQAIKNYIDNGKGHMPTDKELRELGVELFETLFPRSVRRLYDTARSLQGSERLNVILTSTIPWVADKPWEFAFDPVRNTALATGELHFIRNVMTAVPAEVIDDRQRLRILVASSQPVGLGKLSVDEEIAVIRRGFEPLREAGLADVDVLPRATPASLHGYVSTGRYSVVHFIGHGEYDRTEDRGYLVFQDERGNPYRVNDRSAREILCGRSIRMVFLNACETGSGGHADFNSGVAPALVAGGVPIVVANQYKVLDASATSFAQHFYWSLAHGMGVGAAAREARIAVNYSLSGESIDWAVPVLYARDPNSTLSPVRDFDLKASPSPSVRASSRRKIARHKVRLAVWDIHSQFPELRATLDKMSAAQDLFGFEVVDLSVPMDAWHVDKEGRYLDANRFVERLAPQISQLGVHFLSAIVNEQMGCDLGTDDAVYNIYGYWPERDKPPVLVFSTKGLDLEPKGPRTERALANVAVSGIAGYLIEEGSHEKGPRDCPNYYNGERDVDLIAKQQKFCKACIAKLHKGFPEEHKALSAILRAVG